LSRESWTYIWSGFELQTFWMKVQHHTQKPSILPFTNTCLHAGKLPAGPVALPYNWFQTYYIWNGGEWVKNNWQLMYDSIPSSICKLQFKFLCTALTSTGENYIYVDSGNSPSLDKTGNGKQ
jgi:hypothetical protein